MAELKNYLASLVLDAFKRFGLEIQIDDVFDIVIVAVLAYAILILLKRTRSFFIFGGIFILSAVYLLARFFDLYLTTLLFQYLFTFLMFILVVVFQKELRSFFIWITASVRGSVKGLFYRGTFTLREEEESMEKILKAAAYFAHNKIGALMVLKGRQPLDGLVDGGYELDGKLSVPLLLSIFDPSSAGHDGAVIIGKNILKKFGVHLPLAERFMKFGDLGTRHRAALGLSEQSDALVIVVSEERGMISVARNGNLKVVSVSSELRGEIEAFIKEIRPARISKKILYRWLTKNFKEKIFAIVIAGFLWLIFTPSSAILRQEFKVPVELSSLSDQMVIDLIDPEEIKVILSGKTQDFKRLDSENLKISIDASKFKTGQKKITIQEKDIVQPDVFSVIYFSPKAVKVNIVKVEGESVPVPPK